MVGIKPKIDGDNAGMFGFCRCIFIVAWLPAAIQYNNVITSTEIYFWAWCEEPWGQGSMSIVDRRSESSTHNAGRATSPCRGTSWKPFLKARSYDLIPFVRIFQYVCSWFQPFKTHSVWTLFLCGERIPDLGLETRHAFGRWAFDHLRPIRRRTRPRSLASENMQVSLKIWKP